MENFTKHILIEYARRIFIDDSSDEEELLVEKIDNFAEFTVPSLPNRQFQMHFRMSPTTFEDLIRKMHSVQVQNNYKHVGYPKSSLEKEAMILIWCLGNPESFRSVAERFGISKSTCWNVLYRTCQLLLKVNNRYKLIEWPTRERQHVISQNFATNGFPGIIGCIDGSHIAINAPKKHANSYINRKHYHSILLQGICDHQMLFTDVYTGEAGSVHDYMLFKKSDLYKRIVNQDTVFYGDTHLIGDLAYKLSSNLIVGFKNHGNLTVRQKNFNFILNKSRVLIENAFALLKGRFRRLKMLDTVRLDLIALLIVSGCILHNICILNGDPLEGVANLEEEIGNERARHPNNRNDIDEEAENRAAIAKRNNIMNGLRIIINNNVLINEQ